MSAGYVGLALSPEVILDHARSGGAYTHAVHITRYIEAAAQGQALGPTYVQVRRREWVHCARILDAWTTNDGQDMWKLEVPGFGVGSFPVHRVRQCVAVDGRCACERETMGPPAGCAEPAMRALQAGRRP